MNFFLNCKLLFKFVFWMIVWCAVMRLVGLYLYRDLDVTAEIVLKVLFNGLRVDISLLGYAMSLPLIVTFFANIAGSFSARIGKAVLLCRNFILYLYALLFVFMELCTYPFMNEYGQRPNRLFFEYLKYPQEVFSLISKGHTAAFITVIVVMVLAAVIFWKILIKKLWSQPLEENEDCSMKQKAGFAAVHAVCFVLLAALCFIAGRSSFDHRPFNPSTVYFSEKPVINALTLNSVYSAAFSLKQMSSDKQVSYAVLPDAEVIDLIHADTAFDYSANNAGHPFMHHIDPVWKGKKKNIVILLEESLGARYVKSVGGKLVTPNVDRLYREGIGFTRMYATGTRSVRGIEAVTAGFLPTVNSSVVKRERTQTGLINIASILAQNGYSNYFIYGGESNFDNMKSFFLGNGYTGIVDQNSYKKPKFTGSWGVSDEDLYNKAIETMRSDYKQGKPFYTLVFSSSNHDPFEFPEDSPLYHQDEPIHDRWNAVHYADYAIGKFYDAVKKEDFYKDTVFILIADHDVRAFGNSLVPVGNFHIPAVIFGGGIEPRLENNVVSQLDVSSTMLSLAGIAAEVPNPGYDLMNLPASFKGRAIMQYYDNFAIMDNAGNLQYILPGKQYALGNYAFTDQLPHISQDAKDINTATISPEVKKALAYALLGTDAYNNGWYSKK